MNLFAVEHDWTTEYVHIYIGIEKMKAKLFSRVRLFATPWTVVYQAPPSMGLILQGRILEWVAISFSSGSSWPRDRTWVSRTVGRRFNLWATREADLPSAFFSWTDLSNGVTSGQAISSYLFPPKWCSMSLSWLKRHKIIIWPQVSYTFCPLLHTALSTGPGTLKSCLFSRPAGSFHGFLPLCVL